MELGHLIKRKHGFGIRFYVERNGTKEQIYLYEKGWDKAAAKAAAMEYYLNNNKGIYLDKNMTVKSFSEKWFNDYAMQKVADTTKRRYAELLRLHIIPEIGHLTLHELKPAHIQSFYTAKINSGLSTTTVLHIHRLLHLCFKCACLWGYSSINPCASVIPPRKVQHEIEILEDNELVKMLDAMKNETCYIPVYIAATTGMRLGEVCGLQISDVDLIDNYYTIRKTYKRVSGKMILKPTKTHRSKRPVAMLKDTDKVLKDYLFKIEKYKTEFKDLYKDSGHFCVWPDGSPILPDYVTKVFKKYVRKLGLNESISFHTLRHTHASWLLRQGVHPKVVSERLGHTSVTITLNTYSHLIPDMQKNIINELDSKIFEK